MINVAGMLKLWPQLLPLTVRAYVSGTIVVEVVIVITVVPKLSPSAVDNVAPAGTPDTDMGIPWMNAHPLNASGVTV